MCEPREDKSRPSPPKQRPGNLDLDDALDLDNSWPLDRLPFLSNPSSPFIISPSEQPFSPLWTSSDEDNKRGSTAGYNLFLTYAGDSNSPKENPKEEDDNGGVSSPFRGKLPLENPDSYCVMKERMTQALRYFKESTQHVLAQVWAPVKSGDRYVLTTSGQPFVLDPHSNGLHKYRMVSLAYVFSVDGESDKQLGLPGRVFQQKLPE
ncbi:hypothetical protein F3Y22_tig00110602pilonHSYRG00187 [Hibiscus syriacus]|uniref:Uncharacterized protein n=1 Tax=Hibiscus syriacus TaxID=106335 RepID=A0A6A3A4P6_HIBSY|nr:hypothetical protein F3Y22_tig00110602pilonHSYRG00187 [Hibiscus syriacus]